MILFRSSNQNKKTTLLPWQPKKQYSPLNLVAETAIISQIESVWEIVEMYSRWRLAVQNTCSVKITKLANMQEEMEVFVKNWGRSIPQSVAIATAKAS